MTTTRPKLIGAAALALYLLSIPAANWAFTAWGYVSMIGSATMPPQAPAAALVVGFTFLVRDYAQKAFGVLPVLAAIATGVVLSYVVADAHVATASGVAFAFSELADLLVFSALRRRGWTVAVAASNVVGAVVDSVLFLQIAFHSLDFLQGQLQAKLLVTLVWLAAVGLRARRR